jgi:hypothetical protein
MGAFYIFSFLAVAGALWATIAAIRIAIFLEKKGIKTPFFLFKFYMFRNQRLYKETTLKEDGKIGPLYNQFVVPINLALFCGLTAVIIRLLAK